MKTFFYSLWHDLKRNKVFNILMFLEVFVLLILLTVMLGIGENDTQKRKYYDKANAEIAIVMCKPNDLTKLIGTEGYKDIGLSSFKKQTQMVDGRLSSQYVNFVNSSLVKLLTVSHDGDWFSGEDTGEYKEALAPAAWKNDYELGQTYVLNGDENEEVKIKIIGYLGKQSHTLSVSIFYEDIYQEGEHLMVCDSSSINTAKASRFMTKEKPAEFYLENENFEVTTLEKSYDVYRSRTYDQRYYLYYIMIVLISLAVVCVVFNSVFKVEKDIKRNMLKYVVGNSNKNIILGEIVKSIGFFVIPLILVIVALPIVGEIMKANSSKNIMTWDNLFIASGIVLAIYIFSTFATLMRTILAKPLKELRKD